MDTRAIAGFTIRIHSTTVPDRFQRGNARFNHLATRFAVLRNHKPHTTGRMFMQVSSYFVMTSPSHSY